MSNVYTLELQDAEETVVVSGGKNAYIRNLSSNSVYASKKNNIIAGAEGVYEISSGEGITIENIASVQDVYGKIDYVGTIFVSGVGKIQIITTDTVNFKSKSVGGGGDVPADVYSKSETDSLLSFKANADDVAEMKSDIISEKVRIDNLIVNPDGSSEIADVRVGANDEIYATAGEAVRRQITNLKEDLKQLEQQGYPMASISDAVAEWMAENPDKLNDAFVTPEMFGAVGDGITDDSNALIQAITTGKDVYCQHTYLVHDIIINQKTTINGGNFINNNSLVQIFKITASNVNLFNMTIDGRLESNGVLVDNCDNVRIVNCEVKNAKYTGDTSTCIKLNRAKNVLIDNCSVHDCYNDNSAPITRGIQSNRSNHVRINNCKIYNIDSVDDADGIHIIHDGDSTTEINEKILISFCDFWNCRKRCIKIQQTNVTVEHCTFLFSKSTFQTYHCAVSVYDNNATLRDNYFNCNTPYQVFLCGDSSDTNVLENVIITGNNFEYKGDDNSQGFIATTSSSKRQVNGLIISNNTFVGNRLKTVAIKFNNDTDKRYITVCNNVFREVYNVLHLDYTTTDTAIYRDIIFVGNVIFCQLWAIWMRGITLYGLVATGNTYYSYETQSGLHTFFNRVSGRLRIPYGIIVENNSFSTDSWSNPEHSQYWTKYRNWMTERGDNSSIPTDHSLIKDGAKYLNTEEHITLTHFGGSSGGWYRPDGTLFEQT